MYLFLAALGLRCCARALSSCGEWGPLLTTVHGPLTTVASPVVEHGLQEHRPQQLRHVGSVVVAPERRLSSCGSRAQLLRGMWDLPRPGPEPVSPALAGGPLTTAPPGKPNIFYLKNTYKLRYFTRKTDF